jgi:predicted CopG family antitoxin
VSAYTTTQQEGYAYSPIFFFRVNIFRTSFSDFLEAMVAKKHQRLHMETMVAKQRQRLHMEAMVEKKWMAVEAMKSMLFLETIPWLCSSLSSFSYT